MTQQSLLELEITSFSHDGLRRFVDQVEFVLNSIPPEMQLSEMTMYSRMRKVKVMQRHVDRIGDSRATSHVRTWDWLFNKLKICINELHEDQNEESLRASLQSSKQKQQQPTANVAKKGEHEQAESTKALLGPAAKPKAKPKAKAPDDGGKAAASSKGDEKSKTSDAKGQGKGKGKSKETKETGSKEGEAKPKAKSTVPCLFFPKGTCNRGDSCPFVHQQPKAAAKAKPAAAAKATVAFIVGTSGVSQSAAAAVTQNASKDHLKKSAWHCSTVPCTFVIGSWLL